MNQPTSRRALLASMAIAGLFPARRGLALTGEPFPVSESEKNAVSYKFQRHEVDFETQEQAGAIVIDQDKRFLFEVLGPGRAMRYGISVGKYGYWSGETVIGKMEKWPVWTPTPDHLKRRPDMVKYINGMPGGPKNPMGARALYLYQNNADTSYRIHGTDDPKSIGTKHTAGCFGMLNIDAIYLYGRVQIGTRVVVLPA